MSLLAASLALSACAAGDRSYGLDDGDANYDALKAATENCEARGGKIELKAGYDSRRLASFVCKIGKAG